MTANGSRSVVPDPHSGLDRALLDHAVEEAQLLESRYRLLADHASDVVYEVAIDGSLEWMSPSVERVLGWDPDRLIGTRPWDLLHPEDRDRAESALVDVATGVESAPGNVLRLRHRDGTYRWMTFWGSTRVVDGAVTGLVGSLHDVTIETDAVAALAASEARYRMLVDNSADVVVHSVDGVVQWISPAVETLLGWSVDDIVGRSADCWWHPDDRADAATSRDAAYGGRPGRTLTRALTKAGAYIWVEASLHPVDPRDGVGIVVTLRDVNARVAAQRALAESEARLRMLVDNAADVVVHTVDGVVEWVSPSVAGLIGWTAEELLGNTTTALFHPDDLPAAMALRDEVYAGKVGRAVLRFRHKSGGYVWIESVLRPIQLSGGREVVGALRDVGDLVRTRDEAKADRARLQATLDSLLDPHVVLVAVRGERGGIADFTCTHANRAAFASMGLTREHLIGSRLSQATPHVAATGLFGALIDAVATGEPVVVDDFIYTGVARTSGRLHFDVRAVPLGDGLSLTWRDVTDRQRVVEELAASEERFRLLAENVSDVVMRIRDGTVLWASPSVQEALGWSPSEMVGWHGSQLVHPDDLALAASEEARIDAGAATVSRFRLRSKDGTFHWVENHARPYVNTQGDQDGLVVTTHVVDAEVAAEQELDWRARHDDLTRLLNRQEALDRLAAIGSHTRRAGDEYAVVYCDIDDFKSINDRYGHAAGDDILRAFGSRIRNAVRQRDFVARLGGDEILVILDGVHDIDEAYAIAEKIRLAVVAPVETPIGRLTATLSIGVTLAQSGESLDALMARADRAMYLAKRDGRDRVIHVSATPPVT